MAPAPKKRRMVFLKASEENVVETQSQSDTENTKILPFSGTIRRIILKNMFCHDHLDFDKFETGVNLLQGANGSGKSAIVASIIAGLGGSSKATDRAKSLTGMIKTGKTWGSVEIHLRNDGLLPYKPEVFPDRIIVERRIVKSGSSTYKIKNSSGVTVSTKKADLQRILDWLDLQINNPIVFMSQERAKTFLCSTEPKKLYELYMEATQFKQIKLSIEATVMSVSRDETVIRANEENVNNLYKEINQYKVRIRAIEALEGQKKELTDLNNKILWTEIAELEKKLNKHSKSRQKYVEGIGEITRRLEDLKKDRKIINEDKKKHEEVIIAAGNTAEELTAEKNAATREYDVAKARLKKSQNERAVAKKELETRARHCTNLMKKLEHERSGEAGGERARWQEKFAQIVEQKEKIEGDVTRAQQCLDTNCTHIQNIENEFSVARKHLDRCVAEASSISYQLNGFKSEHKSLIGHKENLSVYGAFIPKILSQIQLNRAAFDRPPIGPVGVHVKVNDQNWIHIVEKTCSGVLTSFLVFSKRDLKTLQQIFSQVIGRNERPPSVIVMSYHNQVHEVRRFEVRSEKYRSLWSVIDADNVQVANALLDQLRVESILLVPDKNEANDLLLHQETVPVNCDRAITLDNDIYYPSPNFKVYAGDADKRTRYLQVSVEDRVQYLVTNIKELSAKLEPAQKRRIEVEKEHDQLKNEYTNTKEKINKIEREIKTLRQKLESVKRKENELKNNEEPESQNVYTIQLSLKDYEDKKKEAEEQFAKVNEEHEKISREFEEKNENLKEVTSRDDEFRNDVRTVDENEAKINERIETNNKKKIGYEKKKADFEKELKSVLDVAEETEELITTKTEEVQKVAPERIDSEKSSEELKREYESLKHAISNEASKHGDLRELVEFLRERRQLFDKYKSDIREQKKCLSRLHKKLEYQEMKFESIKDVNSMLLIQSFKNMILYRNLVAKVEIDHNRKILTIRMKKGEANEEELQSLQMMSGGERSFATVSFILSLWQIIQAPVRIMDEFDVFMDAVTRKQCLEMIFQSARPNIEYVLVSPQGFQKTTAKNVNIFRMPDPIRVQRNTL